MRKIEDIHFDRKRDKIIDTLVDNGIFKVNGKQLYELSLYELMKQYMKKVNH
ncbi:Fur-regulated basic protein FbpA [Sporosarcina sp. Te-1]|uniref:Fur-regulated basic protein FbpA n=1 Tax=Sporosarcina sp. Te-1 TaxID=2818390 RepID=UPI001A9D5CC8|nr:Fur-regulated basic protein FbpA [Sporosarcina sp. Te-1]QTD42913.1 Fur-regulated basic protein FbpA [Sporosarcina sp. Te-1]